MLDVKRSSWVPALALTLTAALLAACSPLAHDSHRTSSSPSVPPPASSAHLTSVPQPTTSYSPSAPSQPAARKAFGALLTAGQLSRFAQIPYTDTPIPQPCSSAKVKPVLTQAPPATTVGAAFSLSSPAGVLTEQLNVYASAAQARKLVTVASTGLGCNNGVLQLPGGAGQQVALAGPADILNAIGGHATSASGWTLQNGAVTASLSLVVVGKVAIVLLFVAPSKSELGDLPSGPGIARQAVADVRAAGIA